jgi:hypothetical protein
VKLYPLNGFWFCLGWSIAFLIPSLVLAVQLSTAYRYTIAANSVGHSDVVTATPGSSIKVIQVEDLDDGPPSDSMSSGEKF